MSEESHMNFFWEVAEPFLAEENVIRSTMMGFPCLRINGDYFASSDHKTGDLIIKLAADRVEELIEAGTGHSFAPNGDAFASGYCSRIVTPNVGPG